MPIHLVGGGGGIKLVGKRARGRKWKTGKRGGLVKVGGKEKQAKKRGRGKVYSKRKEK